MTLTRSPEDGVVAILPLAAAVPVGRTGEKDGVVALALAAFTPGSLYHVNVRRSHAHTLRGCLR